MSIGIVSVHDAIGANVDKLPPGPAAGYTTGSGSVPWSEAQIDAHPGVVLIDQTPVSGPWDATADVDDYENGAVLLSELAPRAEERMRAFKAAARPGQRQPAIYFSASNVHTVANALVAARVSFPVGFWIADWGILDAVARADVENASGPFPIIGVQESSGAFYDTNVFSGTWLANVSRTSTPPPSGPPYPHYFDGHTTVGQAAASRHMTPEAWLEEQIRLQRPNDVAWNVGWMANVRPPLNTRWWTENR